MSKLRKALKTKLLGLGGNVFNKGVDLPHELDAMLNRGKVYPTKDLKQYKSGMQPNQCHRNSAILYQRKSTYKLITGYALYKGVWLSHSWLFNGRNIVETTNPFDMYFGYELDKEEAKEFVIENW